MLLRVYLQGGAPALPGFKIVLETEFPLQARIFVPLQTIRSPNGIRMRER